MLDVIAPLAIGAGIAALAGIGAAVGCALLAVGLARRMAPVAVRFALGCVFFAILGAVIFQ